MINTINMHQAKALIDQHNIDSLIYVDKTNSGDRYTNVIFKKKHSDQLYQFYYYTVGYYYTVDHDLAIFVDTDQKISAILDGDNHSLNIGVVPVKKATVTKYIIEDPYIS